MVPSMRNTYRCAEPSTTESLQSTDLESMIEINVISPSDDSIPDMEQPEADPELDISFLHEEYPEPSTTESLQSTDLESMIEINVISPSDDSIPDMEQPEADPELDISFLHEEYPEPSTTESLQSTDLESMIEINVISPSDDSIPDMEQPEADTELDISFLHEEYPEPSTTESLQSTDLESMIEINVISPSDDSIPDMEQPEADPELDISFLHEEYPEPSTTESLQSTDLESMIEINVISPSDDSIPDMEQPEADPELDIWFLHEEYPEPSTTESLQSTDLESMIEINVISPSDDSIPDMEQPEADPELDISFLHEEYPEPSTTESLQSTDLESMIEINVISPSDDSIPDMEQPEADPELDISFLHEEYPEPSTTESLQSTDLESMIEINVISPSDDSIPDMEQPEADPELDIWFLHEEYPEPSTTESLQSTDLESMIEINVISPSDDSIPDMEQPEADPELDISFLHEEYPEPSTTESLQSTDLKSMIEINVISPSDDSIPDMEQPEADPELDIWFLHEEYPEPSTTESLQSTDLESMIEINVISPSDDSIPDMEQPEADPELDISFLHEEYPEPSTTESLQSTDLESMIEINVISPSDDSIPDMEQPEADTELDISFLHEEYPEPSTTESLQSTDLESMIEINVISPSDDSIPDMEQPEADPELDISFLHEEYPEPSTTESLQSTDLESMIEINVISPSDDSIPDMEQPEADPELDISFLHEEYPEPLTTESLQSTDLESMIEINVISPSDDSIPDMEQPEADPELDISFLHEEYPEPSTTESLQSTDLESMIEINVISPSDDSIPDMEQPEADPELDISFLHEEYPEPSTTESLQSTDLDSMIEINVRFHQATIAFQTWNNQKLTTELDISFLHEEYPEPSTTESSTTESLQSTDLESMIEINVISPSDDSIPDMEQPEADPELDISFLHEEYPEPSTTESLQSTDLKSMIEINVISPSDDSIPDMEQPEADPELDIWFLHEEYPEPSTTESLQSTDLESMIEINVISPSDDSIPDMEQPEADTELDISFLHEEYPEPSTTESLQSTDLESMIEINVISPSDDSIPDMEQPEADTELDISFLHEEYPEPSTTESLQSTDLESMIEINVISPSDDSIPDMEQPEADTELDISFLHEEYPEPSTTESLQSTDLESMIEINVISPSDDSIPDMKQPEAGTELDISFLHEEYPEPSTTESLQSTDLESMIEINVISPSDDSIPDMEQPEANTELDISFLHEEYPEPSTTESLQSTDLESMIEINVFHQATIAFQTWNNQKPTQN